jgi:parallel beta-helix repeat protein
MLILGGKNPLRRQTYSGMIHIWAEVRVVRLVLSILLAFAGIPAEGANFYISSSAGSNAYAGTSPALAWRTLDKIFLNSFQPGDSILLMRGDVFDGGLRATLHGTPTSPVTIGTYGTLPQRPIILGDLPSVSWQAVPGHPGYYKAYVGKGSIVEKGYESGIRMSAVSEGSLNLANPADLETYLGLFTASSFGPSDNTDTIWVRTGDGGLPTKVHLFRGANFIWTGSHDAVVQDLDVRNFNVGVDISACTNIVVRNVSVKNTLSIGIYLRSGNKGCIVENCTTDSTGYTALYILTGSHNTFRDNQVSNVTSSILGISTAGGEYCAIGLQESNNNLVEYNTASHVRDSGVDFYLENGDTVRNNTFSDMLGGLFPDGVNLVISGNTINLANGGSGIHCSDTGVGTFLVNDNIIRNVGNYGIMMTMNHGATAVLYGNLIQSSTPITLFVNFETTNISSMSNTFVGPGKFQQSEIVYQTLEAFRKATGQEQSSRYYTEALSNPNAFTLSQNFPNPFNSSTTIRYALPESYFVSLKVYDALGQEVATLVNSVQGGGSYSVEYSGEGLASGSYFYHMQAGANEETRKMLLIR